MQSLYRQGSFTLKRQVFALTGKVRIYTPDGSLAMYSEQKMFRLREDIRVYADENKTQELLWIQARQVIDFAAAYDVTDSATGQKVGTLRRKGFRSMVRDAWEILSPEEQLLAVIREDSMAKALLRRLLLGSLLPQSYEIVMGQDQVVGRLDQRFNLFRYEMALDFSTLPAAIDRRLALAAAILLAIIEGKQQS